MRVRRMVGVPLSNPLKCEGRCVLANDPDVRLAYVQESPALVKSVRFGILHPLPHAYERIELHKRRSNGSRTCDARGRLVCHQLALSAEATLCNQEEF